MIYHLSPNFNFFGSCSICSGKLWSKIGVHLPQVFISFGKKRRHRFDARKTEGTSKDV